MILIFNNKFKTLDGSISVSWKLTGPQDSQKQQEFFSKVGTSLSEMFVEMICDVLSFSQIKVSEDNL